MARSLAQRVGTEGSVLALDLDTTLLEDLRLIPQITVKEADLATFMLPGESFDLVHTRNLLMHLPDRDRILQGLFRAVRPGGILLVEEADGFPASAATNATFRRTFESLTQRWTWARTLPTLVSAQDPETMRVFVETEMLQGGSDLAAFWHHTLRTARTLLQESDSGFEKRDVDRTLELLDDQSLWTPFMAVVCVTATKSIP